MKHKLFALLTMLLCATTVWADNYNVGTDSELRAAIANDGANITVTADINLSNSTLSIESGMTVTIDLGGFTLDRKLTKRGEGGGQVITVREGATLNLSNGTLKGGWGGNAGGINNEGGTANLTDVNITGCTGDDKGGAICNRSGGTLTMKGGSITDNTSFDKDDPTGGGGMFNAEGATATLTGVTITGNEAKVCGGGGICNVGTLTIDGGSITGNTAGTHGAGIWQEGTLNVQGAITVKDNYRKSGILDNVYLYSNHLITVTGALDGSSIGVTMRTPGTFTSGYHTHNTAHPSQLFSADNTPDWQVVTDANYEARLDNQNPYGISYIERSWDDVNKKVVCTRKNWDSGYTAITSESCDIYDNLNLTGGKYIVKGNVTIDGLIHINGTDPVEIVLTDNSTLNAYCIDYSSYTPGTLLSIYAEEGSGDLGKIIADGSETSHKNNGLGGNSSLVIHGGDIAATGSENCAGIGSQKGITVSIYGGNIKAYGSSTSAGIGAGSGVEEYGTINIYGGTILAEGGYWKKYEDFFLYDGGPGIGGAKDCVNGRVHIYGGDITANGRTEAAGIGASQWSDSNTGAGTIIIDGGHVVASGGGEYGAGIGGGDGVRGGTIIINGGHVEAYGGRDAAGIGGGEGGDAGIITITGGYVYAEGGWEFGAGIGGGQDGNGGTITITGGTVVAKSGNVGVGGMRGIGPGGGSDDYGSLTIGDNMMVSSWNGGVGPVSADSRRDYCWYHTQARVELCTHKDLTYTVSGNTINDTHTAHCPYCTTAFEPEQHNFADKVCTVCGITETTTTYTVKVYLPGEDEKYAAPVEHKVIDGEKYNLLVPLTTNIPINLEFAGWLEDTDPAKEPLNNIETDGTETLLPAGTQYTVTGNVKFFARYKKINITLADNAPNGETLSRYDGKQVNVTLSGRTLKKDGNWNTLCLPFNVNDFSGTPLAGATVKMLQATAFDKENGTLTITFNSGSEDKIMAGHPYIVKWDSGDNIADPVFNGVTISNSLHSVTTTTQGAPEGTKVTFTGSFSPVRIDKEDRTMLYLGAASTLYYPNAAMTIKACRSYFQLKGIEAGDVTNAQMFFGDDENTTAIRSIDNGQLTIDNWAGAWYDLQGRRITNGQKPKAKGLYIHNGKKLVIK